MTLYCTYSADGIKEIIGTINPHLHKNLAECEMMLGGFQHYWYKYNIAEKRITHMTLNSLLHT